MLVDVEAAEAWIRKQGATDIVPFSFCSIIP